MTKINVYKESKEFDVNISGFDDKFKVLSEGTKIVIKRNSAGNQLPPSVFETTFGEAVKEGWLSTDKNTMEYSFSLHESESKNFYGFTVVDWLPAFQTFGVFESYQTF